MEMLTRKKAREKRERERKLRQEFKDAIKIYDLSASMKGNPFSGDTTALPFDQDNRKNHGTPELLTEQDVLESLIINGKRLHVRKSDVQLCPDMVTDEIKDYYRSKILASALRSAKNKKDNC